MADAGMWEMLAIFVVALLVLGPERLPLVARKVGYWIGRARQFVTSVKADVEREIRSEELEKLIHEQARELQNLRTIVTESRVDVQKSLAETEAMIREIPLAKPVIAPEAETLAELPAPPNPQRDAAK